ncbi:hypothetical protein Pelo_12385 [Pelomyxa schiedti]|nr:hypothetical protein Pelo_12385 [Pelomyxa schiedti]
MRAEFTVNWCDLQVLELMLELKGCTMIMDLWASLGLQCNRTLKDKECMGVVQGRYAALEISPRITTEFAVLQICLPEFLHHSRSFETM